MTYPWRTTGLGQLHTNLDCVKRLAHELAAPSVNDQREAEARAGLTASHPPAMPPAMMCVAKPTGFLLALRGIPIPIPAPAPACARYVGGSVKCSRSVEMVCTTGARGGGYGECGAESGWCGAAAYLIRGAHARGGEWSRYHVNARASAVPVSAAGAPAPAGGLPLLQPRACAPGAQTRAAVRERRISPLAISSCAVRPRSVLDAMHHVLTRATSVASPLRHTRRMLRLRWTLLLRGCS